jgi:ferredoxin--NADP+ reductase
VEDFFLLERLDNLEKELGLGKGELRADKATIFICGLTGTIGNTLERLLHRGFVPDNRRVRKALEVPEETPSSLFYEQYDTTPPVNIKDPDEVARLKALYDGASA